VDLNGGKMPVFLWVDRKTKTISFSPVELYRPIWDTQWDTEAHSKKSYRRPHKIFMTVESRMRSL
jgi:hypothetical protein